MPKAVVLGATGFIGSHIARELQQKGFEVRITQRSAKPSLALEGVKYESVPGDLDDVQSLIKAFEGCDYLFHTAGYYPVYSLGPEPQKQHAANQVSNVLQAIEKSSLKKIIITSAIMTFGRATHGLTDETTPYDPKDYPSLYYDIKYQTEQSYLKKAKEGFPIVILNPAGVFGDYDVKPTSGQLLIMIAKSKVPTVADALCNIMDVRELARVEVEALEKGCVGERYGLGGINTTAWEFGHLVARIAKSKGPSFKIPMPILETLAYTSEFLGKYVFHQERPLIQLVGVHFLKYGAHYNLSKAKKELGLKETSIEEMIERALNWFKRYHYL